MHTMSQVISHFTTGESKSMSKGRRTQYFIAKTACNLHLTQGLSTHSLTRLDFARMPYQGGGSSLRSISPTSRVHPSKSKWMKPHKCVWPPTPHTMTISSIKTLNFMGKFDHTCSMVKGPHILWSFVW